MGVQMFEVCEQSGWEGKQVKAWAQEGMMEYGKF
jgi:hypothetical protein